MPVFLKKAERHLTESERADVIFHLASNPEAGDVMPETGGVRKIRWAVKGRGKMPLVVLDLFAKNEKANLTASERNELRALMPEIVRHYQSKERK